MTINEMRKRLGEFAEYLDQKDSSKEKGELARYFTAYCEAMKKIEFIKGIMER